MELYAATSYRIAKVLTNQYSTSFSYSSKFFSPSIRSHIYAVYGMVRVADEIVDSYQGADAKIILSSFKKDVLSHMSKTNSFSPNPIIQAFSLTAKRYGISEEHVVSFFNSMEMDLTKKTFTASEYAEYIYGSAEVIGLMCLKIFCANNAQDYEALSPAAKALGSAFQKVNFLRDIAADHHKRGRYYFPQGSFETFDDSVKQHIEQDISNDFAIARAALPELPVEARKALRMAYAYYFELFTILKRASASNLKQQRFRVPASKKLYLLAKEALRSL